MRINKRLQINVVATIVMAIVICLVLFLVLSRLNLAYHAAETANEIMSSMLERATFRNDYLRNNTARAQEQWFVKHEQIGKLLTLSSENLRGAEERKNITKFIEDHESIGRLFTAIVANREKNRSNRSSPDLAPEVVERLTNQLNIKVYDVVLDGRNLLQSSRKSRDSATRLAGWSIISSLLILIAVAIFSTRSMGRAVAERIERLRSGAEVIGSGDLDHRIEVRGDDEFTELSDAFNAMTEKLSRSYHDLENEIRVRTRAEEELRLAYDRLRAFFDQRIGGIGIVIANAEGNIIQSNDYYLNILGCSREELLGGLVDWRRMTPPEWLPADEIALDQLRRRGVCDTYEKEYLRRDGSRVPVLITDVMMPEDSDEILAFILDITDRKQAELALQAAHDELANQVEERTRELHEKEVLLKEIHHRVKNNLQVICSLVGLQADSSQDETVRAVLSDVTDRVRSMALVHEKLYQSSDLSQIDFAEYARGLLGYLWRAHGNAAAVVRLTLDLELVALPIDTAVPCGLILNELAGNALKHAFPGRSEGEVTVSLRESVDGRICLCVDDNGVGLPAGLDWRQAQSLGLHLVQLLSRQLDAEVEYSGGEGTRFALVFGNPRAQN